MFLPPEHFCSVINCLEFSILHLPFVFIYYKYSAILLGWDTVEYIVICLSSRSVSFIRWRLFFVFLSESESRCLHCIFSTRFDSFFVCICRLDTYNGMVVWIQTTLLKLVRWCSYFDHLTPINRHLDISSDTAVIYEFHSELSMLVPSSCFHFDGLILCLRIVASNRPVVHHLNDILEWRATMEWYWEGKAE